MDIRNRSSIRKYEQLDLFLDFSEKSGESVQVKYDWTDEDIEKLREGILMEALHSLTDGRQSEASKAETIEWLKSDDIAPFSFVVCCRSEGLIPSRVREGVNEILRKQTHLH